MDVNTSRFGTVKVDPERVLTFPKGLLGFSGHTRYVLIQPNDDGYFFWLQSLDSPELAFVVTDPGLFITDYQVPLKPDQLEAMGLDDIAQVQVLVIVNKRGTVLTGNLQGPLIIHAERRNGEQLVLADRRFHTRVPLLDMSRNVAAASA